MQMDPRLNCEYERAYPRTQPYSRLPYDKRAEKAWWADYYRRNPTLLMRLARRLKAALRRGHTTAYKNLTGCRAESPLSAGFLFLGGEAQSVLPARMCRSPFRFLYNVVYW